MTLRFEILRRRSASDPPYTQTVIYDRGEDTTVAGALTYINAELLADDPVMWEHSCGEQKCGACAMLINGVPRLACGAWLREFPEGVIKLEPLSRFPPVRDLVVDRGVIFENLKKLGAWLNEEAVRAPNGTARETSGCIRCGCCLEICPNFGADGDFFGAPALAEASRLISAASEADKKRIFGAYKKHSSRGCRKSSACRDICPAGLGRDRLTVNSKAAGLWKRLFRRK